MDISIQSTILPPAVASTLFPPPSPIARVLWQPSSNFFPPLVTKYAYTKTWLSLSLGWCLRCLLLLTILGRIPSLLCTLLGMLTSLGRIRYLSQSRFLLPPFPPSLYTTIFGFTSYHWGFPLPRVRRYGYICSEMPFAIMIMSSPFLS